MTETDLLSVLIFFTHETPVNEALPLNALMMIWNNYSAPITHDKMKSALMSNISIRKSWVIVKLFACEYQSLLIYRHTIYFPNFFFHDNFQWKYYFEMQRLNILLFCHGWTQKSYTKVAKIAVIEKEMPNFRGK